MMTRSQTTAYLVALRGWYDRQRQALMRGEELREPMPAQEGKTMADLEMLTAKQAAPMLGYGHRRRLISQVG
jgi:hypothetical protein